MPPYSSEEYDIVVRRTCYFAITNGLNQTPLGNIVNHFGRSNRDFLTSAMIDASKTESANIGVEPDGTIKILEGGLHLFNAQIVLTTGNADTLNSSFLQIFKSTDGTKPNELSDSLTLVGHNSATDDDVKEMLLVTHHVGMFNVGDKIRIHFGTYSSSGTNSQIKANGLKWSGVKIA